MRLSAAMREAAARAIAHKHKNSINASPNEIKYVMAEKLSRDIDKGSRSSIDVRFDKDDDSRNDNRKIKSQQLDP